MGTIPDRFLSPDLMGASGNLELGISSQTNFRESPAKDACLGFHVRLEMDGAILAASCLKVHPDWMRHLMLNQPSFGRYVFLPNRD